ncbi:manganese efflux pump MntP family protein [Sphingomonas sp. BGYR3]|uniref:manganese efflux pump MntP n=1 Tax=Sphingomonas sp. BGYR3 TaxID=2975483 RepID=UPI0021A8DBFD|nr:manganese efflux pump MntP family protein [Sphingomonas sp. BGYR3]MDG5489609.1 manganese efflux pump MntP family protein [Sphingomonas sp. BGYR3]
MTPLSITLLSFSMSADAFAASVGRGAASRPSLTAALRGGLVFGVVEAITPLIGWTLGLIAAGWVEAVDHWIAFGLLTLVGGHMILQSFGTDEDPATDATPAIVRRGGAPALVATAIGTSIDAAAIGVGLAFIGVNIWLIAASIGMTTFAMTTIGLYLGGSVGTRLGKRVELLGGVMLIGIGLFILADHTGWIA